MTTCKLRWQDLLMRLLKLRDSIEARRSLRGAWNVVSASALVQELDLVHLRWAQLCGWWLGCLPHDLYLTAAVVHVGGLDMLVKLCQRHLGLDNLDFFAVVGRQSISFYSRFSPDSDFAVAETNYPAWLLPVLFLNGLSEIKELFWFNPWSVVVRVCK